MDLDITSQTIAVAMSGGVDSSVAAALLVSRDAEFWNHDDYMALA